MRTTIWELCTTINENWLDTLIASFFQEGPRPGFGGAVFRRKRMTGAWPTFEETLRTTNENPKTKTLRAVRCMSVGQEDVGRLLLADKHLLSQIQYSMLGFRLYVLLKGISEIALRPIQLVAAEVTGTEQHSLLEQEYGIALVGQMLDLAKGFYKGTQGLEGRGNHNAMLLVELFWWLQWQAEPVASRHHGDWYEAFLCWARTDQLS
jgi:hypothetical protein